MDSLTSLIAVIMLLVFAMLFVYGIVLVNRFLELQTRIVVETQKLQGEVDRKLEGTVDRRVCDWCSKTGVPAHVNGVTLSGKNARDLTWYCSKECYRTGHGAS